MINNKKLHQIAKKLIVHIIFFSTLITIFATGVQLYIEYKRDISVIDARHNQIKVSYLDSIAGSVWIYDWEQLQIQIEGIKELPDIVYVAVTTGSEIKDTKNSKNERIKDAHQDDANKNIYSGKFHEEDTIKQVFPLSYNHLESEIQIGHLTVISSLTGVYARLWDRVWIILISNGFKTFLVAIFMYFIVVNLVTRHLYKISSFARNFNINNLDKKLELSRKKQTKNPDELDSLVHAINSMQKNLKDSIQALSKNEQNLSITLNSIADAVISTNAQGMITRMNPVAEKLTGWTETESRGLSIEKVLSISDYETRENIDNPLNKIISTGETVHLNQDTILHSKDGNEYLIAESAAPIKDKEQISGMVLVFNDVTERKKQEEQLRQSQKMDALGKLTGGIAHDYNNMLGIVLGYVELAQSSTDEPEELDDYLNEILRTTNRGVQLTKKLLSFSRKKASTRATMNINTLLLDEKTLLSKTLTSRIQLTYDLHENLWPTELDAGDLEDAIINMCINAMHAIEDTGKITIKTGHFQHTRLEEDHVHLPLGDYVTLSITDTGSGMTKETQQRLFEPFYSTKGERGTGLGLSQVYGFVERSNGTIKLYSELGHGSRFIFYFPRCLDGEVQQPTPTKEEDIKKLQGSETILVVDDEKDIVNIASKNLRTHGYNVFTAADGLKAIDVIKQESIDLVITDVIMPNMDGYHLAEYLQQNFPNIKIQIVSGFADDRHKVLTNKQLHENILDKPYTSIELLKRIRQLLDSKTKD